MNRYETLDDIMELFDVPEFFDELDMLVVNLPISKETVDFLLDITYQWDWWTAYNKLLTECADFLDAEQIYRLRQKYEQIFDIPLTD